MDCDQNPTALPKLTGQRVPFWSGSRTTTLCAVAALLLIIGGLGLRRIALDNTDLESLPQLAEDARTVYAPTAPQSGNDGEWWASHASGLRAWKLGWRALNGQVDSRVLHLGSLALHVTALGILFFAVATTLPRHWAVPLAVGTVLLFETPALVRLSPATDSVWGSGLLILSLLHLGLMGRSAEKGWGWWAGLLCGALNLVAASAGIASAVALVSWSALCRAGSVDANQRRTRTLWANAVLAAAGIALVIARARAAGSFVFSFTTGPLVTWPFAPAWVFFLWAPAAALVVSAIRHRASNPPLVAALSLLAMWAALVAAVFSAGTPTAFAAADLLGASVVLNAACFAALPSRDTRSRTRNLVLFSVWTILVGNALLHPVAMPARHPIQADDPLAVSLRQSFIARDPSLLEQTGLTAEDRRAATELIRNENVSEILPASIRPPLRLEQANAKPSPAFRNEGYPELPVRDRLPAWGTWSENAGTTTGEFVSTPLATAFPLLQFRVAGMLRPPATSLVLRAGDGTEVQPLNGPFSALDKWRRINFTAPRGPFQIVARDASAMEWLAFTAPVEGGEISRVAGKLPRWWPWLLAGGCVLASGGALFAWRRVARAEPHATPGAPVAWINWRVVPWIVLGGYAVFFANHLDPVAGPNDSGGYLNLAKTLVEGHVTAAPRMLFGPAVGETDITPYLTTTFQPRHDGRMVAEYPVGFPLEIWAFAQFLPLRLAVPAVLLLQLVLGIVFTRLLAKGFGLPEGWAWLAGGMVGMSAVYLFQALQPQSDGPALVWVTAAVYWAWSSRTTAWHAILAGLATALAVLIRPSNLLCLVPILLCLAGNGRQTLWWVLAGLPGAALLAWYNHELYGSWHRTGYGDVSSGFGLRFVPLTLRAYALWLPKYFTPILGLSLAAPFLRAIPGRVRLVLTSWAAVFLAFYAAYWCTWDNWYNMRFVLPAMPAMLVLALWTLRQICLRFRLTLFTESSVASALVPTALLMIAIFVFQSASTLEHRVIYWTHANYEHASAAQWVQDHLPGNAVVFAKPATNPLWYYTNLTFVRSDHPQIRQSPDFFPRIVATGRPVYALTYHWEQRDFKWDGDRRGTGYPDLPGTWERVAALWEKEIYVWKLISLPPTADSL